MTFPCVSENFAQQSTLAFGQDRIKVYGPFRTLATGDGVRTANTALIDQTVDWTYDGSNGVEVRAHVLFNRPVRRVRAQGPKRHFIEENWAITTNGAVPVLPGGFMTSFAGGHDRNSTSWYWTNWEAGMTYMPVGASQVVRTIGQQIRVRYTANLAVSSSGGSNMHVFSYWHEVMVVTTPMPV